MRALPSRLSVQARYTRSLKAALRVSTAIESATRVVEVSEQYLSAAFTVFARLQRSGGIRVTVISHVAGGGTPGNFGAPVGSTMSARRFCQLDTMTVPSDRVATPVGSEW